MRTLNRELWAVSVASGIRSVGYGATWPYMALFFNRTLGVPIYVVGIIFTLGSVVSIVFSLAGGGFSDFIGRKKTLLIGSTISFGTFLGMALLLLDHSSTTIIIMLFIFTSVGGALVFPSANALVADVTTEAERTNGFVVYRILSNLGWAIGPLSGSILFQFGIFWVFVLVAVSSIIQGVVVLFAVRDRWKERKAREMTGVRRTFIAYDKYLLAFTLGTFFLVLVSSQFAVTLPVYAGVGIGIQISLIGYIYAVNGTVVVLGQYPTTRFMRRFPEMYSMILGTIAYSIGYFLVAFSSNVLTLMADMVVITIGENLVSPVMNSIVSKIAPPDKLARYLGFMGMVNSSGRAIGPSIGAFLISLFAYNGIRIWLSIDAFGVVAVFAFIGFIRLMASRKESADAVTERAGS